VLTTPLCTHICVVYVFSLGLTVLWPIYTNIAESTRKPRVLHRDERGRWFFVFSDLIIKTYLLTYKSYILTNDVIGSGAAFFWTRTKCVHHAMELYICEMTDTIKNILNDRRMIVTQFCRRLTKIILLLSCNVVPIFIIMHSSKYYVLASRTTTKSF